MAGQPRTVPLQLGRTVTLDSAGAGEIRLGPDVAGPPTWRVTGVILQTSRPGQAPVPRCEIYRDQTDAQGRQGLTYDGSFASGRCDLTLVRGQVLIARWTGGLPGDIAELTLTGDKIS